MKLVWHALGWFFSALLSLFAVSLFLMGGPLQGVIVLGIVVFLLPPVSTLTHRHTGKSMPWWGRWKL